MVAGDVMENELQGGEKRYTHQQYGMMVAWGRDYTKIRFYKKSWVPAWLWNLRAIPDWIDVCDAAMLRAEEKQKNELAEMLAGGATKGKDGGE